MNIVRLSAALLICGSFGVVATHAQQTTPASTQQTQNQNSQNNQSQYSGVSNPPPDSTIVANEPMTQPDDQQDDQPQPTSPQPTAKPSPAIPAQPSVTNGTNSGLQPVPPQGSATPAQSYNAPPSNYTAGSSANSNPNQYDNTDYGIVTQIQQPLDQGNLPSEDTTLQTRQNPSYGIVSVIPFSQNALNAGTDIQVRLLQSISTNSAYRGTPFRATVMANVYRGGQVIIPAGSELRGSITSAHPGHRLRGRAELRLTPQYVLLPDGTAYHLDAQVVYSGAPHTDTSNEGVIRPTMHLAKDATEYGVGAGAGAVVGAEFGPGGALVGTAVGAGAVTAHLLMQPPSAVMLPRNTELVFSLMEPMALTPTHN